MLLLLLLFRVHTLAEPSQHTMPRTNAVWLEMTVWRGSFIRDSGRVLGRFSECVDTKQTTTTTTSQPWSLFGSKCTLEMKSKVHRKLSKCQTEVISHIFERQWKKNVKESSRTTTQMISMCTHLALLSLLKVELYQSALGNQFPQGQLMKNPWLWLLLNNRDSRLVHVWKYCFCHFQKSHCNKSSRDELLCNGFFCTELMIVLLLSTDVRDVKQANFPYEKIQILHSNIVL